MAPADRADFEQMMHSNMDKMSPEERQSFKDRMRASQGFNKGEKHNMHRKSDARNAVNSMTTMERAGFINMMRNNMGNMSDTERHAFFDYMGFDKSERHSFFERLGIKHQNKHNKADQGCKK